MNSGVSQETTTRSIRLRCGAKSTRLRTAPGTTWSLTPPTLARSASSPSERPTLGRSSKSLHVSIPCLLTHADGTSEEATTSGRSDECESTKGDELACSSPAAPPSLPARANQVLTTRCANAVSTVSRCRCRCRWAWAWVRPPSHRQETKMAKARGTPRWSKRIKHASSTGRRLGLTRRERHTRRGVQE